MDSFSQGRNVTLRPYATCAQAQRTGFLLRHSVNSQSINKQLYFLQQSDTFISDETNRRKIMKKVVFACLTFIALSANAQEYRPYSEIRQQFPLLPEKLQGSCVFLSAPTEEGDISYIGWLQNNLSQERWVFAKIDGVWTYQSIHPLSTAKPSCYGMV